MDFLPVNWIRVSSPTVSITVASGRASSENCYRAWSTSKCCFSCGTRKCM